MNSNDGSAAENVNMRDLEASVDNLALDMNGLVGSWEEKKYEEMMPCGIHRRPDSVPTRPRYETDSTKDNNERYYRRLQIGEWRGSCLCDFYDFPILLNERLEANPETKQQFSLMKLPAELRVIIYQHMFAGHEIEFCPEPFTLQRLKSEGDRSQATYVDKFTADSRAYKYHEKAIRENIKSFGRLLRTNKLVHEEAMPILYGESEFRFTNMNGWAALDVFMHQIGIANCSLLRKITVRHPAFMTLPSGRRSDSYFWDGILVQRSDAKGGFFGPRRWFENTTLPQDPILVLQKLGTLTDLCVILPQDCNAVPSSLFDESKFANLATTFVSFILACDIPDMDFRLPFPVWAMKPAPLPSLTPEGKSWAQETVVQGGNSRWFWDVVEVDANGCYKRTRGSQDDPDPAKIMELGEDEED